MTFADLYNEVINLRFSGADSTRTTQTQRWVNHALARIWNADEWIFKYGTASVAVTSGSSTVSSIPADFGMAIGLWRADGYPVLYRPIRDFEDLYLSLTSDTGAPQHFMVVDQAITVGPISNETSSTYTLAYEKRLTNLSADSDTPALPAQHHYLIVTGALSEGLRLMNDFTWEFQEQAFLQGIQDMRKEWLVDQRGEVTNWGRDQIEALPTAWGT